MGDVTELRRLERSRREFASNVSHELKTPLTSIQAYADALLDGGLDDPDINRGFVERIVEQSQRLLQLIGDLLKLSRMEAHEQPLEMESLDVQAVLAECLPAHQTVALARGLILHVEQTDPSERVSADREGLRTVIDNLVRNALAYTPAGGSVTVRTRRDGHSVCLEVEDTGVGIPRELQGADL